MRKLTAAEVRALRKQGRCPDCRSDVVVDRRSRAVNVRHDDTCPMLARLRRSQLTTSVAIVRPAGANPDEFAARVVDALGKLSGETGQAYQIRTDPYRGLPA